MLKRISALIISFFILFSFNFSIFASGNTKEYYSKRNSQNKIALTFDDGPHPRYTPKILDILDRYNVKATFFIIGIIARNYPDTLKMVAERGHQIGNHTFTHEYVKGKSIENINIDLKSCENEIYKICGEKTVVFRPPGGLIDHISVSQSDVFDGYDIIYWSIDTLDWAHKSPEEIAEKVLGNVKSGDIILMHDYIGKNSPTPEALEIILPKLIERGFEFVTVSELIALN